MRSLIALLLLFAASHCSAQFVELCDLNCGLLFGLEGENFHANATSCGYPDDDYAPYQDCTVAFDTSDPQAFVSITIIELAIESCEDCACDSLTVTDFVSGESLVSSELSLESLCGNALDGEIFCTASNAVNVTFVSDGSAGRKGFWIQLTEVPDCN